MESIEVILDAIAPEFVLNVNKSTFINLAKCQTSTTFFGECYNLAVALRTAHMLSLSLRSGAGGQVTNKSEGDLSIGFSSYGGSKGKGYLDQTSYGLQLLDLLNQKSSGFSIISDATL